MYRFLVSRGWLGGLALAVVAALACVLLGLWQWDRHEQRRARNTLVTGNYDRVPADLPSVLASPAAQLPAGTEWTPVTVTGQYLVEHSLVVRNRPLDGSPGYHVLVPLRSRDGTVLVVDRGWLPVGQTGRGPDEVPPPPSGTVQVTARLRPGEAAPDRSAPAGQVQAIHLPAVADLLPDGRVLHTGAYGVLAVEDPAPSTAPRPLPRPSVDEGPHLSYALQWFAFAVGALVAYGALARRRALDGPAAPGAAAPPRPARRRWTAEDAEDALLDAAERASAARASAAPQARPGIPPREPAAAADERTM